MDENPLDKNRLDENWAHDIHHIHDDFLILRRDSSLVVLLDGVGANACRQGARIAQLMLGRDVAVFRCADCGSCHRDQ